MRSPFYLALLGLPLGLLVACDDPAAAAPPERAEVTQEAPKVEAPATAATEDKAPDDPVAEPAEPVAEPPASAAQAEPADAPKPAHVAGPANKLANGGTDKPVEDTKGAEAASDTYGAWLQAGSKFTAGEPAAVTAVLAARGGFKCNDKYPYKFTLDPAPSGVSYPSTVVSGMAVSDKRSTMSIPFTPTEKGAKTISGTLAFSVCDADKCLIEKQKLSVTVNVM